MRRWVVLAVAMIIAAGCGPKKADDDGPEVVVDLGNNASGMDAGHSSTNASNGSTNGETNGETIIPDTIRDDLDVVLEGQEVEITDGLSGRLAFDVPDDAVSVIVVVTGDPGTFYTLSEWKNGDGSDVVANGWLDTDQGAPSLCLSCSNRIAAAEAAFAGMLPNNDVSAVAPGTHNIAVYAYQQTGFTPSAIDAGTATVDVYVKRLDAEPTEGVLDINFYFTGANGWTAETAKTDEEFQQLIADVDELYDQVGIDLGVVTYTDISEDFQVVESIDAPNSDLQEMFMLSADQPRKALNIFIVEELVSQFGRALGIVKGISGGIPGPPLGGTRRSGVAIATKEVPELPAPLENVMAHEVGHHLGLYHTSENELAGGINDPIEDTPPDDDSLLMFNVPQGNRLTTTQGNVMRRNPWVYHGGSQ